MFEGYNQAYIGVLEGGSARASRQVSELSEALVQEKKNCWAWSRRAEAAEARVAELEHLLAVKQAVDEADSVLLGEWKRAHPNSPMMQPVGRRQDGSPLTRGLSTWITAFDRIARGFGITNPEAHRIS